jgi:hypothetical protein
MTAGYRPIGDYGDHAVTEGDQDEGAEELGQQLSPRRCPQAGDRSGHRESPPWRPGRRTVLAHALIS